MRKWTALVIVSLASLWLASPVAWAADGKSETKTVTGIQVELTTPAEGLKVGENSVSVRMKEAASGLAVVRDVARIDLAMDEGDKSMNHSGMSMSSQKPTVFELKPLAGEQGRYEGKVTLSDPGDWNLRVFTDSRGVGSPATFKVNVGKASPASATTSPSTSQQATGPNWIVLGGIAVLALGAIAGLVTVVKKSSAPATRNQAQETTKA